MPDTEESRSLRSAIIIQRSGRCVLYGEHGGGEGAEELLTEVISCKSTATAAVVVDACTALYNTVAGVVVQSLVFERSQS